MTSVIMKSVLSMTHEDTRNDNAFKEKMLFLFLLHLYSSSSAFNYYSIR